MSTQETFEPIPFTVQIPDDQIQRLVRKLKDYELPDADVVDGVGWSYGVSLEWAKDLQKYWLEEFDWRTAEAEINQWDHYTALLEDVRLHFIHQKSAHANAVPLILIHGWPGTFHEFNSIIQPLTSPQDGEQPFHVVIPSVPGFGFSSTPRKRGWTVQDSARLFDCLMTDVLGYESYAAQGGDWGSIILTCLSSMPRCKAIHLNMCVAPPPVPYSLVGLVFALPSSVSSRLLKWYFSPEEYRQMTRTKDFVMQGAGYFGMQATQPLTTGLALNDSPMGLLIWLGEKYNTHVDPTYDLPKSTLLTTISIYYFTRTFASSCLPYHENKGMFAAPPMRITDALLGVSIFKHDILVIPKSWIAKWHRDKFVFYKTHDRGGHFPALDNPDELVEDIRTFLGQHAALFSGS